MRLNEIVNVDRDKIEKTFHYHFMYDGEYSINPFNGEVACFTASSRLKLRDLMERLPIKFSSAYNVTFYNNRLKDLTGSPTIVEGYFDCSHNNLSSLIGGPREVSDSFSCFKNTLISLEGLPKSIGKNITLSYNPNLGMLRLLFVEGLQYIELHHYDNDNSNSSNIVENILQKYLGQKRKGAISAAAELTKAGFKGNARL